MHTLSTPNPAPPPPARAPALTLSEAVYREMRTIAEIQLLRERTDHTLQPTALVHEAYMRLVGGRDRPNWDGRGHFFASAAEAMRRILVERARARAAQKRGGDRQREELGDEPALPAGGEFKDVIGVDELLKKLEQKDARKAQIVTLRFFGGLSNEETAMALGLSLTTVKNEWAFTRAWLHRELEAMKGREE